MSNERMPFYKGQKFTDEHRRHISRGRKKWFNTHVSPLKGTKRPEFSETMKEYYKTHIPPNKGKHHSEATKKRISNRCKKAGVGRWNLGRPSKKRKSSGGEKKDI